MLAQLIAALQKTRLDMTAEEIADMLWLASYINTTQQETDTYSAESSLQDRTETFMPESKQQEQNKQATSSPSNADASVDVHPTTPQSDTRSTVKGFPFRSPAASALPNTLLLARALRPLMRRLPSKTQLVLNQQATVQRIAETDQRIWAPVLEPLRTRQFDIELLIDEGASMLLWQQLVIEWRTLLEHHGAFRNVRIWRLTTNDREYVELYAGPTRGQDLPHDPKELIDPSGRRLILLMTDCVSPAWHSGKVASLLDIWGHQNLVSLIQVFPRRLWQQTALANADLIQIDALLQYISNSQLKTHAPVQWLDENLSAEDGLTYPVVTLEYRSLHNWARMITGTERTWIPGISFASDEGDVLDVNEPTAQYNPLPPTRRLQLFHANASPTARKLIGLLAAAPIPINLEVIRLIQRTMLPEASQVHIAEVLLSGLLEEIYGDPAGNDFNNIEYDFVDGVRDELLNAVAIPTAHQVLKEISSFVDRYQGKARDFLTLITMPDRMDQGVFITHEIRPFAQIASTMLRRYGGDFATVAKKLEEQIQQFDAQTVEVKETSEWGSMVWGRDKWGIDMQSTETKEASDPKNMVEHGRGRILVVDPWWGEHLVEILNLEGYIAEAVGTAKDALKVLHQGIYHLLIMETRFDNNDVSNTSSMTLLSSLKERGLNEATKIIILSGSVTAEQMRTAFREFNVVDVLLKHGFNRQHFLDNVRIAFEQHVGVRLLDTQSIEAKETSDRKQRVEHKRGRILIEDGNAIWRKQLVEILSRADYIAEAVSSVQEVLEHLEQSLYHILILDGNTDGWELLRKISELHLDDALKVMMVSAHATIEQVRIAFRDYNVSDFIIKSSFNQKEFQESIQRIFEKDLPINLKLSIMWQQRRSDTLIGNLEMDDEALIQSASPTMSRLEEELDDLLRRLSYKAESILVRAMKPGYSETKVLLVKPFYTDAGGGRTFIVKFGSVKKIRQEYDNFKQFVEPFAGGKRCTGLLALNRTPLLAGITYSLLGASGDQPEDFGAFYVRAKLPQLKRALERLFNDTCGAWYANPGRLQPHDLTADYQRIFGFTVQELEQATNQFSMVDVTPEHIKFRSLPESVSEQRTFLNPLVTLLQQQFIYTTYVCTQHSDLNQHNLLVDNEGYTWMIDFQSTGLAHILCDITTLDSIVRFQLLPAEAATLEERLEMEIALCSLRHFSQVDQLPNLFITSNPLLAKAFAIVVHLRQLARALVGQNPDNDIGEYYVALFYNALNTIRYENLAIEQREHALLCASLLANQIG